MKVYIEGKEREYEPGTRIYEIVDQFQADHPYDIILASVDGKLSELHKKLKSDSHIRFITTAEKPGMQTYQRSATLIMLKAFYEVVGADKIEKVAVDFSIGKGFFVDARGDFAITEELLSRVKAKMHEYVERRIPFMKRSVSTQDAVELFERYRMYDKARLFSYRRVSRVNLYSLDGFEDYFYGYMAQNSGYIRYFDLIPYEYGFVLMLPTLAEPTKVPEFVPSRKLFGVLRESSEWGEKMEIIMIAGPSSSGKTTFSHRLSIQLRALGLKPHPIAVDDYFVNREDSPRDESGNYNFECLESLDVKQFNEDMNRLLAGETVEMPRYNFVIGEREYKGDFLKLGPEDILVIEGIHCLNDRLSYTLPAQSKFKIYISALTQLNIDEHNRIPTTDGRLIRRMVRDARTRGISARETISRWPSVRRGEEENIFPFQEEADVMFNSALVYELAVLKQYAEPLLFQIPRDCEEYVEAKRLLKFLDYFLGVDSENIPRNSIAREFIGGSCFPV